MPEYRDDILDVIAGLQAGQAGQFSSGQRRPPQTKASAGWVMPNRIEPEAPDDGAHIYVVNGEMRWKSETGQDYSLIPPEIPKAARTEIAANMTAGATAPASYDQDYVARLRDDVREVRAQLNALINSLRDANMSF
ncbi:hypothetical protein Sme01_02730 [Sphaerisporangium melleum]|uniref:Uncharacterized protein n=1 Tax=Sphaerisporangium melleum TaxID=321316 RepID=A0A917QNL0_9ACTN|nr:hypothetical protein [Sphaerisporangium melleum]GGK61104.1 hypothetical protein GCM10007964_00270 [Sphaerisporangium melleum]GII67797.1 hypothetical protein Sme01_02730 [Sphaerisporangium melleum]